MKTTKILSIFLGLILLTGTITLVLPQSISAQEQSYKVSFLGDWTCNSNAANNGKNLKSNNVELLQGLGDYAYQTNQDCWIKIVEGLNVKITRGNHESSEKSGGTQGWNQLVNHYKTKTNPELSQGNYYAYQYKDLYVLALDTQTSLQSGAQATFIDTQLQKAKQLKAEGKINYVILGFHKMIFNCMLDENLDVKLSCGDHKPTEVSGYKNVISNIYKHADVVDIVTQGHDHNTQVSKNLKLVNGKLSATTNDDTKDGIIWAVFGSAGRSLDSLPAVSTKPFWQYLNGNAYQSSVLELSPSGINLKLLSTSNSALFNQQILTTSVTPPPPVDPVAKLTAIPTNAINGTTVILDASASTNYGTISITQNSGPAVTLSGTDSVKQFIAPNTDTTLGFQAIATKDGKTSTAQATVKITLQLPPPVLEICGNNIDDDKDGLIDEDCPAELCNDGIDNDGDGKIDEDCDIDELRIPTTG